MGKYCTYVPQQLFVYAGVQMHVCGDQGQSLEVFIGTGFCFVFFWRQGLSVAWTHVTLS